MTKPGITDNAFHAVRLTRSESTVTVSVDGTQFLSATDARLAGTGQVGVGAYNESAYFDDVYVTVPQTPAPPPPPTTSPTQFSAIMTFGDFANYSPLTASRGRSWTRVATSACSSTRPSTAS